jgi:hypothetical protein
MATPGGDVVWDPKLPPMHFDERGALVEPNGLTIYVDDDGKAWFTEAPEHRQLAPGQRFTPFVPAARRTAEVLFLVLLEATWRRGIST